MKNIFNPFSGSLTPVLDKASEISYNNGTSGLTASEVQSAVDELNSKIETIPDPIYYLGTWDASTNTPTLSNSDVGLQGALYQVNVAGSVDFGAGSISFEIGDKVVNNGTAWTKWDMTDAVSSVNGLTGAVVLTTTEITEGTNLYYTNTRFDTQLATKSTTDLTEGTNLYYTQTRFDDAFDVKTTTDLTEGANLYFTDERAQDAVGATLTNTATVNLTYDDVGNAISAQVNDGSISDVKIASGIDSVKIADGSVSNTEFQSLNGVTSNIQDQIDAITAGLIPQTDFVAPTSGTPANVTGASFSNASVRAFDLVMVVEDGTNYAKFNIQGIQKNADWEISQTAMGDDVGIIFSITSSGQIQYTSSDLYNVSFYAKIVTN